MTTISDTLSDFNRAFIFIKDNAGPLFTPLAIALAIFIIMSVPCYIFSNRIIDLLNPAGITLNSIRISEPFYTSVAVALYASFALSVPAFFYWIYTFIPAYSGSKINRKIIYTTVSSVFFYIGIVAVLSLIPLVLARVSGFVNFTLFFYITSAALSAVKVGLLCSMQVFIFFLIDSGVTGKVSRNTVRAAVIVFLYISLVSTPPDPISMILVFLPIATVSLLTIMAASLITGKREMVAASNPLLPLATLLILPLLFMFSYKNFSLSKMAFCLITVFIYEYFLVLIDAFRYSAKNGLLSLFIPFYASFFLLRYNRDLFKGSIYKKVLACVIILFTIAIGAALFLFLYNRTN